MIYSCLMHGWNFLFFLQSDGDYRTQHFGVLNIFSFNFSYMHTIICLLLLYNGSFIIHSRYVKYVHNTLIVEASQVFTVKTISGS